MKLLLIKLPEYWKTIVAALPALVLLVNEIVGAIEQGSLDGSLDRQDVLTILLTTATAVGVFAKGNQTKQETDMKIALANQAHRGRRRDDGYVRGGLLETVFIVVLVVLALIGLYVLLK